MVVKLIKVSRSSFVWLKFRKGPTVGENKGDVAKLARGGHKILRQVTFAKNTYLDYVQVRFRKKILKIL